jgi:hypothetical protein
MSVQLLGVLALLATAIGIFLFFYRSQARQKVVTDVPPAIKIIDLAIHDPDALIRVIAKLRDAGILDSVRAHSKGTGPAARMVSELDLLPIDKLEQLVSEQYGFPTKTQETEATLAEFNSGYEFAHST